MGFLRPARGTAQEAAASAEQIVAWLQALVEWIGNRRPLPFLLRVSMTESFLPPTSSPSEHRRAEHGSRLTRTPSSEEISPTKFPGFYQTGEPSPPHDIFYEPPDIVPDDEKDHGKKKGNFKKKEKRTEG